MSGRQMIIGKSGLVAVLAVVGLVLGWGVGVWAPWRTDGAPRPHAGEGEVAPVFAADADGAVALGEDVTSKLDMGSKGGLESKEDTESKGETKSKEETESKENLESKKGLGAKEDLEFEETGAAEVQDAPQEDGAAGPMDDPVGEVEGVNRGAAPWTRAEVVEHTGRLSTVSDKIHKYRDDPDAWTELVLEGGRNSDCRSPAPEDYE